MKRFDIKSKKKRKKKEKRRRNEIKIGLVTILPKSLNTSHDVSSDKKTAN